MQFGSDFMVQINMSKTVYQICVLIQPYLDAQLT